MAKEIAPPNPVPVISDTASIDDSYHASILSYSEESFTDTSKDIISYLGNKYSCENGWVGGTTRTFIAENMTVSQVYDDILCGNINGINENNFDNHIILNQIDNNVMIFVTMY